MKEKKKEKEKKRENKKKEKKKKEVHLMITAEAKQVHELLLVETTN